MFAARGIAVSLSVFVIVYICLSAVVICSWRSVLRYSRRQTSRWVCDWLFAWRMFPIVGAFFTMAVLAVPSFLLFEPRTVDEPFVGIPLVLGFAAVALGVYGSANSAIALGKASRAIALWRAGAQRLQDAPVPVFRILPETPAMIVTGIVRPRVLLSGRTESLLTAAELRVALNHEIAHVRRGDNLRKLILKFAQFPGLRGLETAWLEASEIAADDAAVSTVEEALDLATALIKLSRLQPVVPAIELTASLVLSAVSTAATSARIERLLRWNGETCVPRRSNWLAIGAGLACLAAFAVSYTQLLIFAHAATEWLVR